MLVTAIGAAVHGCGSQQPLPTGAQWAQATPEQRDAYMRALAQSKSLLGKTEDEVRAYLGPPDSRLDEAIYELDPTGQSRASLICCLSRAGIVESANVTGFAGVEPLQWNATRWREGSPTNRVGMCRTLIERATLTGLTRDELYAMLGTPTMRGGPYMHYEGRHVINEDVAINEYTLRMSILLKDGRVAEVSLDKVT
ncbi:MAG: hypothetical protein PVJ57_22965 [Phycisphaerae bacterium]|jgi:hypothetical protein